MARRTQQLILVTIILVATYLRLTNLDWDEYNHYHPDERYISWVAASVEAPASLKGAFDPHKSTFNPFYWPANPKPAGVLLEEDQPRRFAYGHVPLYAGVAATRLVERLGPWLAPLLPGNWLLTRDVLNGGGLTEFRNLTATARALTGLVDVFNVCLAFLIGTWLYRPAVGLLAAAFLAVNVMHIQLAHFFAVDPYLTFFVLITIALLIKSIRRPGNSRGARNYLLLAAATLGLAVGSKFTGVLLFLPLGVAHFANSDVGTRRRLLWLGLSFLVALSSFAITNPFAIIDASCEPEGPDHVGPIPVPELLRSSCYLQNVIAQGAMVQGSRDVPFVRQYIGTEPFLYYAEMQWRWGMGPALSVVAFAGLLWAAARGALDGIGRFRDRNMKRAFGATPGSAGAPVQTRRLPPEEIIVLAWVIPFFISTGSLQVKFMRYLQPLVPFLMIYAAAILLSWSNIAWRQALIGAILATTTIFALAFSGIYRQQHPWIEASEWIYENLEPGTAILNEAWDDSLPDGLEVDGESRNRDEYDSESVNWLSGIKDVDSREKVSANLELVAQSDYLILSSNRNYGVIPRLPDLYPLSGHYYRFLFEGKLGFEVTYIGTRMPNFLGVYLKPDALGWPRLDRPAPVQEYFDRLIGPDWGRFDESFTVYDQPMVLIFKNVERLTAEEMLAMFPGQ